jgi:DinB superfamily
LIKSLDVGFRWLIRVNVREAVLVLAVVVDYCAHKGEKMKRASLCCSLLLVLSLAVAAQSTTGAPQASQPATQAKEAPRTAASVMDRSLSGVEKEFVSAAEAMPEDKYSYAPTSGEFKGVRTFAEQIKHVAAVNYMVFSTMLDEKAPDTGGENGPDSIKTKAEIVKYLKESFVLGHRAMAGLRPENLVESIPSPFGQGTTTRLGMGTLIIGHCFDHYGQMVEYLRMNSIVPPASRGQ